MMSTSLRHLLAFAFLIAASASAGAGTTPQAPTIEAAIALENPAAAIAERAKTAIERVQEFTYLVRRPEKPATCTIVLLHGSGGDEASLMALAAKIDPDALLLGVRGRVTQEGVSRWYKRLTPTSFDQQDVKAEAEAFVSFLSQTAAEQKLDLSNAIFLGYSNGANLIGALTLLHPSLINRAVLLRAMPVLEEAPEAKLGANILTIAGKTDGTYGPFAPKLEKLLTSRGARVKSYMIDSGHGIGDEDARLVREWLAMAEAK